MKTYKFEVTVVEGNDEFWEEITADGKSGCDEVLNMILEVFNDTGAPIPEVRLIHYNDDGRV
jgi:hypothetical protein